MRKKRSDIGPEEKNGVLIGGFRYIFAKKRRKRVIITGLLLLVIFVSATGYLAYKQIFPAGPKKAEVKALDPLELELLKPDQVGKYTKVLTGVSDQDLDKKKIDKNLLPTYEKAEAAARILKQEKKNAKALEAYQLAASMLDTSKVKALDAYQLYFSGGTLAYLEKQPDVGKSLFQKARDQLNRKEVSAETRDSFNSKLNSAQRALESGNY